MKKALTYPQMTAVVFGFSLVFGLIAYAQSLKKSETGPESLINHFTTLASIHCDHCRVIEQSSEEAACDDKWTAQEFYDDGWRYYKGRTYCFRCVELLNIKTK